MPDPLPGAPGKAREAPEGRLADLDAARRLARHNDRSPSAPIGRSGKGPRSDDAAEGARVWLHRREEDRLASLASYQVLDTPPEAAYESTVRLAAAVCDAPAAMVTFVDRDRQWFKAIYGLHGLALDASRLASICSDAVAIETALVIEDTRNEPRYAGHPLVTGEPGLRAYAGVPLIGRDGLPLGTLCVLDWRARPFPTDQLRHLGSLAQSLVTDLELRRIDRAMGRVPETLLADALDPVRIRQAIDEDEFVCRYQPIVDMTSGAAEAFEALVRWRHPVLGLIPPALFLPAMEGTGLIEAIGRLVLADALDLASRLRAVAGPAEAPKVAVNVSATQLEPEGFADLVADALASHDLPPAALCLELTESVPLRSGTAASAELEQLRELGVEVVLDDYGAGNATIGKLLELPLTGLKLDRCLVADVAGSSRSGAVVRSTLELAEELGLEVTCEGVETKAQRRALLDAGVRRGQGWLFREPMGRDELLGLPATTTFSS